MKKATVKQGERLTITIERAENANPRPGVPRPNGIIPVDAGLSMDGKQQPLGQMELFDLGTRLKQDGGVIRYEEIIVDAEASALTQADDAKARIATIEDADQLAFDTLVLAGTPLGTTNALVSARPLPNCMPIPYETGVVDIDLFYNATVRIVAHERKKVDDFGSNAPLPITNNNWVQRAAKPEDATEPWAAQAVADGVAFAAGRMKHKGVTGGQLRVRSRLFYEEFDTSDLVNHKITASADFTAAAVPFSLKKTAAYKLWLKPRWLAFAPVIERLYTWEVHYVRAGVNWQDTVPALITLYRGPYASRLPVIPKPTNFLTVDAQWVVIVDGGDGAALAADVPAAAVERQDSADGRYQVMPQTMTLNNPDIVCQATPVIDQFVLQSDADDVLQQAVEDAGDAIAACMAANGCTSIVIDGVDRLPDTSTTGLIGVPAASIPAGLLVGIIQQGSSTYYIWRATALVRADATTPGEDQDFLSGVIA